MPNLVLTFAELLAGAVILDAGIKGDSIANVVKGVATTHPLPGSTSSTGSTGSTGSTAAAGAQTAAGAGQIPAGTFVAGITAAGLKPQVIAAIVWAKAHGWTGQVISGFRTYAEQAALYQKYLAGGNIAAKPGQSNHEQGQAVDVTDPAGFAAALAGAPAGAKLISGASFGDTDHFSTDGH